MRELELTVISELMRNSRLSDRELARKVGKSQPTITRIRRRLEKEGYIREYTMLPDLSKLGYEIMALTFVRYKKELSRNEYEGILGELRDMERKIPHSTLMAMKGIGMNFDRVIVSFHVDYNSYVEMISKIEQLPFLAVAQIETFMVNLKDESHFQPLTFSIMAKHVLQLGKEG